MEEKKNKQLIDKKPTEDNNKLDLLADRALTVSGQKLSLFSVTKEDESIGRFESGSLGTKHSISIKNFERAY